MSALILFHRIVCPPKWQTAAWLPILLAAIFAGAPVQAQKQDHAVARLSIEKYYELVIKLRRGDESAGLAVSFYLQGLRSAMERTSQSYAAISESKSHVCLPTGLTLLDLADAIIEELVQNEKYWAPRQKESLASLAIYVFAKRWPCP